MRYFSFVRIGVDPTSIMTVQGQTLEEHNTHKAHLLNCGGQWTDMNLNENRRLTMADYLAAYPIPVAPMPFDGMIEVTE